MKVAFDLGACQGSKSTQDLAKKYDIVYAVEPIIENYRILVKTIINKGLDNVVPIFATIDSSTRVDNIYVDPSTVVGHSLYKKSRFVNNMPPTRPVLVLSWNNLVDFLDVKHVDFAWVDIEGAEESLLKGMTKVFPKKMYIESHQDKGVADNDKITTLLVSKGYGATDQRTHRAFVVERIN